MTPTRILALPVLMSTALLAGAVQEARRWLTATGVQVVKADGADPGTTHHLRLTLFTGGGEGGILWLGARERCSLLRDLQVATNNPGEPQRLWTSGHLLAQRGQAGFQDSLVRVVKQCLQDVVIEPFKPSYRVTFANPGAPLLTRDLPGPLPLTDFSQIKVRKQPAPPAYPAQAKRERIQGVVVVELTVDATGKPTFVEAISGPSQLMVTAISYALGWEFEPAIHNGKAQAARFRLTMPFKLR